ncbi:MAG: hypothetical protein BMS9Abin06_0967 [Gammaproteobacteria bacterium]|nr:MAG: hypothetical protein BMS9Abin06_0967 [Gammaproteobacteria bacterium]
MSYGEWRPYVSVAQRRAKAAREMKKLRKKGMDVEPIEIQGRNIAHTFWGKAWCKHLERFSDFANRLPRGRTYVRNGSVCHLAIKKGKVEAIVSGSALYKVDIHITPLSSAKWKNVRKQCAGHIGSILELLQGQLSSQVMEIVTDPANGLFPQPGDIKLHCDCPDWADMCKHVAAVLYGIGARLDNKPELLFMLRKVDHQELISADLDMQVATRGEGKRRRLANQDLSSLFGVDIEDTTPPTKKRKTPQRKTTHRSNKAKVSRKAAAIRGNPGAGKTKAALGKKPFIPTGAAVARLRKQFKMTRAQFAELISVSPQTVANWETRRGRLKLQQRTLTALTRAWLRQ